MKRLTALLLAALFACLPATVARANGDPASDVLLSQDSFLPYSPPVQERLETALEDVLETAREEGYPMKVALIAGERDLGAYPQLFNKAQDYTNLLTRNLTVLNPHDEKLKEVHLLVVMPGGFGGNNLGDRVDEALAPVAIQSEAASDGLAKAAIEAVARIATVNGTPIETPPEANIKLSASSASDDGGTSPLVFAAPAILLFGGLFVAGRIAARKAGAADAEAADD